MPQTKFLAAVLGLGTAGAMLQSGPLAAHEGLALGAGRRTVKDVASGRRAHETAARAPRARRSNDVAKGTLRAEDAVEGETPVKTPSETVATPKVSNERRATVAPPEVAKPPPGGAPSRTTDAHLRAKAPTETPESMKSTGASGSGTTPAAHPIVVSFDSPVFDGGEVPRAVAALDRMKSALARCASTATALTKNEASIDLRFLVRAPGRAEGVGVDKVRDMSGDVAKCITLVLSRSYVGVPSDDPVGVAVTVRVRR